MIKRDLFVSPIKIKLPFIVTSVSFSVFHILIHATGRVIGSGWHPSGVKKNKN